MEIVNISIDNYYRKFIPCAKSKGYKWVVTLVAREADVEGLYNNLVKNWESLHSITGREMLFLCMGKSQNSYICDVEIPYQGEGNENIICLNVNERMIYDFGKAWRYDKERNLKNVVESQTQAVTKMKRFFRLKECDVPCLVIHSLLTDEKYKKIIPRESGDIYQCFFKPLFNEIEDLLEGENTCDTYNAIEAIIKESKVYTEGELLNAGSVTNVEHIIAKIAQDIEEIKQIKATEKDEIMQSLQVIIEELKKSNPDESKIDSCFRTLEKINVGKEFVDNIKLLIPVVTAWIDKLPDIQILP